MKGKQAFYNATSPKVLDDILDDMVQKFKQTIPELQSIYDAKGNHVHVQYYDGIP
jgi:predicted secreted protein